ncbi:hypothetical protein [Altererythrobacter sp. MF3-039]|uniref:hypothetical protein n=1 Tax=Altererythrobacter sp. MF3-039 TaxID=3252901 RepID=UPI00390C6D8E
MKRWKRAKSENRFPVVNFTTPPPEMELREPLAVAELTTANGESDAIPPFSSVENFTAHTDVTMGGGLSAWWQCEAEAKLMAQTLLLSRMTHFQPGLARAA